MLDEVVLRLPESFRYMLENCQTLDAKKRTSRSILPRYLIQPASSWYSQVLTDNFKKIQPLMSWHIYSLRLDSLQFGTVSEVIRPIDKSKNNEPKNFCFVTFEKER